MPRLLQPARVVCLCLLVALAHGPRSSAQETTSEPAAEATQQQEQPAVPPLPDSGTQNEPEAQEQTDQVPESTTGQDDRAVAAVEVTDSPETWFEIRPENAGAVFRMPAEPKEVVREFSMPNGNLRQVHMFLTTFHDEQTSIVLSYHDLNEEPRNNNRINSVLDGAVRGAIANVLGEVVSHQPIRIGRNYARDFVYKATITDQDLQIASRIILVKDRLYSMAVVMKEENFSIPFCTGFFESFQIVTAPADNATGGDQAGNAGAGNQGG